ncbi:MAG: HIT domain-containing protein [Candidatus Omnitrophica bacterium]|nr:HIT domain-containing protein [Candidatus Omnitrophota bacterium]
MDRLWAPWRSKYIYLRKRQKCIFCVPRKATGKTADKKRYIVHRSKYSFSILNRYPYNNGHLMIAPFRHVRSLELLNDKELLDLMKLLNKTKKLLDKKLKPDGYNIGANLGKIGGAGFEGHVHIHIVPRWAGDTNFMPVLGNTKVISESLDALYHTLKAV